MTQDVYQELRENRVHLAQLFESKGWEILLHWTEAQVKARFEEAIRLDDPVAREAARIEGLTMEKFIQLSVFLAEHAGIGSAEGAPIHTGSATPEA